MLKAAWLVSDGNLMLILLPLDHGARMLREVSLDAGGKRETHCRCHFITIGLKSRVRG